MAIKKGIARNSGHFAPVINCQRNLISKMADKQGKRNRNLELFFPSERLHASTLDAKFSIYVTRDRELVQYHDVYA